MQAESANVNTARSTTTAHQSILDKIDRFILYHLTRHSNYSRQWLRNGTHERMCHTENTREDYSYEKDKIGNRTEWEMIY